MPKNMKTLLLCALLILSIGGCSSQEAEGEVSSQASIRPAPAPSSSPAASSVHSEISPSALENVVASSTSPMAPSALIDSSSAASEPATSSGELAVHFGDDGAPFAMHLYDNETAAAIAAYVGTADWRLPIYNYNDYENWEVMQFYDLPSRYEIPASPEAVTSPKAGEVYYSDPNRIVLFYADAEVTAEYTRVGYFEATEEFINAVQNNPVLEGWGNKIVLIKD